MYRYRVGITPSVKNISVQIYDAEENKLSKTEGNIFEAIRFINKKVKTSETVVFVQNVDMFKCTNDEYQNNMENLRKKERYSKFQKSLSKKGLPEIYKETDYKVDFFKSANRIKEMSKQSAVMEIFGQAFGMINLKYVNCDNPVNEKIMEEYREDAPSSYPGGANDNYLIVKRS